MNDKQTVLAAIEGLFGRRDLAAIPDYFGPEYTQHSALAPDGLDGLRRLVVGFPPAFRYEPARVLAEGGLVVTQGLYSGFGPGPVLGFDVWRVEEGRIVEHWDALGPVSDPAAEVAGSAVAGSPDTGSTAASRRTVQRVIDAFIAGEDLPTDAVLISGDSGEHHAVGAAGAPRYLVAHQVIAEGDLVYVRSEGELGGSVIINDLWRVEQGRIVEHWGLVAPVPPQLPHGNGSF